MYRLSSLLGEERFERERLERRIASSFAATMLNARVYYANISRLTLSIRLLYLVRIVQVRMCEFLT